MAVYFLQAGDVGPVKIGSANNVEQRHANLQVAYYEVLRLIRILNGGREIELKFHWHYRGFHLRSEWFSFCPTMKTIEVSDIVPETVGRLRSDPIGVIPPDMRAVFVRAKRRKIAELCGVTQATIGTWWRVPRKYVLVIAAGIGVDPSDLRPDIWAPPSPTT